ncbi:MAG: hypothetical protein CMF50_05760 [Legionellales bacterium]|nr:hypothetical protein [Legionellales bacterium]|tara:strand:+ start:27658 stop:28500 length:843 start_codon:yes stop_codon:yes gene_type:complete
MDYSKKGLAGLGAVERARLAEILRINKPVIDITTSAKLWKMDRVRAAKVLSRFSRKGWLNRIASGSYVPVPLSATRAEIVAEDPFVLAQELFSPCYISGEAMANYWGFTEQLFRTMTVMTERTIRPQKQTIAGIEYILYTLQPNYFFGLEKIWYGNVSVNIPDPTRTVIDLLLFSKLCGSLRFINDVLINYFNSDYKDINLLINYLDKAGSGAAIKRLGFLVELNFPGESKLLEYCNNNLTSGYIKLTSGQECSVLISRWGLWVPKYWKDKFNDKQTRGL